MEIYLKNQTFKDFDDACLLDVKEDHISYTNVTIQEIFVYLHKNHGKITCSDLLENKLDMIKD